MQRIEHEASVKDAADRQADESRTAAAFNVVDQTHDLTKIAPADWVALSPAAKEGLRVYQDRLTRRVPIETDLPTYYGLMRQASDDPQTFSERNLLELRGRLDEADFKQLTNLQGSLRARDQKRADAELGGFRSKDQILRDTLVQYGIDPSAETKAPTSKDAQEIATIRRLLDDRVEQFQEASGKKADNGTVQTMLDQLMTTTVDVPGIFSTKAKRLTQLSVSDIAPERPMLEDVLRRAGRPVSDQSVLTFDQDVRSRLGNDLSSNAIQRIPKADRDAIGAALQRKGRAATAGNIVSLYLEILARQGGS
jgi:hypothetical protein